MLRGPAGLQPAVRPRAPADDASSQRGADVVSGQRARPSPWKDRLGTGRARSNSGRFGSACSSNAASGATSSGSETRSSEPGRSPSARRGGDPDGLFYVQSKFTPSAPILGAYAFETSAYSALGLAGWRSGRRAQDAVALAPRPGGLARLRADGERRRPLAPLAHAAGHADHNRRVGRARARSAARAWTMLMQGRLPELHWRHPLDD